MKHIHLPTVPQTAGTNLLCKGSRPQELFKTQFYPRTVLASHEVRKI
jgi:hypothetical protein